MTARFKHLICGASLSVLLCASAAEAAKLYKWVD